MIDEAVIYAKTERGIVEVKRATPSLAIELRRALILVDGKSTAGALITGRAALGANAEALSKLLSEGYIEPVKSLINAASPARDTAALAASSKPARESMEKSVAKARAQVAKLICDALGPDGTSLALKVERAATVAELRAQAERCHAMLEAIGQRSKAGKFWAAAQALLD
jgi:hypothetical protein